MVLLEMSEVAVLDRNAEFLGVSTSELMENAGKAAAERAKELIKYGGNGRFNGGIRPAGSGGGGDGGGAGGGRLGSYNEAHAPKDYLAAVVMCGPGNNGGDGLVAARSLSSAGLNTSVVLVGGVEGIKSELTMDKLKRLTTIEVLELPMDPSQQRWNEVLMRLESADLVMDALLGVGLKGELRPPYNRIVRGINSAQTNSVVISIDVPTGLGSSLAVIPSMTVTFHAVKEGMTAENCGKIVVEDIGIPQKAGTHIGPGCMNYYRRPEIGSHKGENGRLLVVGGGPYTGAPALAGMAALRTGVDLVHLAVPGAVHKAIASMSPHLIVHPIGSDATHKFDSKTADSVLKLAEALSPDAVLLGPGVGPSSTTMSGITKLIKGLEAPMVLDADAFGVFTGRSRSTILTAMPRKNGVVTPHAGEFQAISGKSLKDIPFEKKVELAKSWAKVLGWTVMLKGSVDIITDGDEVKLCDLGNDAMSVGGTGDILAGVTAGLLAKGATPMLAARMAAFLTNHSGDRVFRAKSYGLLPMDVIETIPDVLRDEL